MKKILSYLLSPFFYIYFGLILLVFQPVQWICYNVFGYNTHKKAVDFLNFFLLSSYYVMGTRIIFRNTYKLPENRSIIFVSNHQSMFDISGFIWFLRHQNPKFISKRELATGIPIPSISYNLKKSGAALIDRSNPRSALQEIERMGKFLNEHQYSAVLFPEGTRSRDGNLKPFAIRGFLKLMDSVSGALIVPVVIENAWKMTRYGMFPISFGERVSWTVLEPIEPGNRKMDELLRLSEIAIRKQLKQDAAAEQNEAD